MSEQTHITVTDELLVRFLAGEAGPDEAMAVGLWLETPANAAAFEKLQQAWDTSGPGRPYTAPDVPAAWLQWRQARQAAKVRRIWPQWAAAALVLLAGSAWFLLRNDPAEIGKDFVVESGVTEKRHVLPDGSETILQPGAKVTYPAPEENGRFAELTGSATFHAKADPQHPFTVQAGPLTIRVVGTTFEVKQYTDSITVSVRDGAVMAIGQKDSLLLKAGMRTNYLLQEARFTTQHSLLPGGRPSKTVFEFNDTPLGEAVQKLSDAYGIPVLLDNPALADCRINTSFTDKPLDYVLTVITESLRLEYRKANDTVYIYGNACE
ncbi:FecR domain-containing protein [Chitinophaga rhizosphaerae]|uniref:FecR domain-containing protein n=1 Tax=Chitinophaga rhizosphaerae TaxID=1864947 RepID=UPI000F801A07|nr:FecR domain-containing protein [Chitinophaga rhizosphaerae]